MLNHSEVVLSAMSFAIQAAIIESMETHKAMAMAMKALSDDTVKNGLVSIIFDMLMKSQDTRA